MLTMKETLIQLIREDIRTARLVRTLASIEIDASAYHSAKSAAVFHLLQLGSQKEELQDQYFMRIEKAADGNRSEDAANTENVLLWLSEFTGVSIF